MKKKEKKRRKINCSRKLRNLQNQVWNLINYLQ